MHERYAVENRAVRILASLLLALAGVDANARRLDLSADCVVPSAHVPSETSPFQLDWCKPADGDDITGLLVQIANRWPGIFYAQAPARSMSLVSDTVDWFGATEGALREFGFIEPAGSATVRIRTPEASADPRRMWVFTNLTRVVIGGVGLRLTFQGTHPGLGSGEDGAQAGLLEFVTSNGSTPALADIRANFERTWKSGVHFMGGESGGTGEVTRNRFRKVNIAGRFVGSGVNVLSGVHEIWYDPARTVISDPWNRGIGWDGKVAGTLPDGTPLGCSDTARYMYRNFPPATAQYTWKVTGGVTMEYGMPLANIFVGKYIGNGQDDPFVVRIKDWGFSGPTEITGYPAGVMGKMVKLRTGPMKHDPLWPYEFIAATSRFIRFEQLESTYGIGVNTHPIASGCAPGNLTDNNIHTSAGYIWQAEATSDGVDNAYVTAFVDVAFHGFTPWRGLEQDGEYVKGAGGDKLFAGSFGRDRTFGHTMRVTKGTWMPGTVTMLDTNTITGPGTWSHVAIERVPTTTGGWVYPNDNTIESTSIGGLIRIGDGASRTTLRDVDFVGDARLIVEAGRGSDLRMDRVCAPSGARLEGAGSVMLEGKRIELPYTFGNHVKCSLLPVPTPPEDVIVD